MAATAEPAVAEGSASDQPDLGLWQRRPTRCFRLIALGTDQLQKQGYNRKGSENVVGPMPPMGTALKAPDEFGRSFGQPVLGRRWSRPVGFCSAVSTAVCAIRAIASGKPQIFKR